MEKEIKYRKTLRRILKLLPLSLLLWNVATNANLLAQFTGGNAKPAKTPPFLRKLFCLSIGNNHYNSEVFPDLKYAEKDAQSIFTLLRTSFDFDGQTLLGKKATKKNILNLLDRIKRQWEKSANWNKGVFIFYFAGHGYSLPIAAKSTMKTFKKANQQSQTDFASGTKERVNIVNGGINHRKTKGNVIGLRMPYVVPYKTTRWKKNQRDDLLSIQEIIQKIKTIPALHTLVLFDSCYSGFQKELWLSRGTMDSIRPGFQLYKSSKRSLVMISAGTSEQQSLESEKIQHGAFTYSLLQVLQNLKDSHALQTLGLFRLLSQQTNILSNGLMTPKFFPFLDEGEFCFVKKDLNLWIKKAKEDLLSIKQHDGIFMNSTLPRGYFEPSFSGIDNDLLELNHIFIQELFSSKRKKLLQLIKDNRLDFNNHDGDLLKSIYRQTSRMAHFNNPFALLTLAKFYEHGVYVPKNKQKALELIRQSLETGNPKGIRAFRELSRSIYQKNISLDQLENEVNSSLKKEKPNEIKVNSSSRPNFFNSKKQSKLALLNSTFKSIDASEKSLTTLFSSLSGLFAHGKKQKWAKTCKKVIKHYRELVVSFKKSPTLYRKVVRSRKFINRLKNDLYEIKTSPYFFQISSLLFQRYGLIQIRRASTLLEELELKVGRPDKASVKKSEELVGLLEILLPQLLFTLKDSNQ